MRTTMKGLVIASLLLGSTSAYSQVFLRKVVVGSGGGAAQNGSVVFRSTAGQTVAGTASNSSIRGQFGFWNAAAIQSNVADESVAPISEISIVENPIRTTLNARLRLSAPTQLDVWLYDLRGSCLRTLTSGFHAEGRFDLSTDVSGLAAGTYLLTARVPGGLMQRKISITH